MVELVDRIDFQTLLVTSAVERQSFGEQMLLVDHPDIPVDVRFRFETPSSWDDPSSGLTSGGVPYEYAEEFFAPDVKASQLMFGRWVSAASSPYWVAGAGYEKSFAVWEAISDGSYKVVDNAGTPNEVEITGHDFTGITALDQILPILNAKLAALVAPAITGLENATWSFDPLGRLVLSMATTGSAAATIYVTTAASGTDLAVGPMDSANGKIVAGLDVETQIAAVQAISALNGGNVWYNLHERGGDDTNREALAAYIETQEKLCDLVLTAAAVKDSGSTTDLAYILSTAGYKRTLGIYTEHTDEYPDAGAAGRWLPFLDGEAVVPQFEWKPLPAGITQSGLTDPLTPTEYNAVLAKNCNVIENIRGVVYLYNGLTFGNVEKRLMFGRDWFNEQNRADIFDAQIARPLNAFDNATITNLEKIIRRNGDRGVTRGLIVNTPDRPITVTLPDADSISAATRATHTFTVLDAFVMYLNSAIHDYKIVGEWRL